MNDLRKMRTLHTTVEGEAGGMSCGQVFLRFRFGDRKEILRDRLEEF